MTARILYIEDNDQNYYLVRFLLEARGHHVTHAVDGVSGLEALRHGSFDLILLDIDLPGMDGYSVARAARDQHDLADTPIVAVTSYALTGDREKALEAGCSHYIEKPINPKTFTGELEAMLLLAQP